MNALLKFIKISVLLIALLVIGTFSFLYYMDQKLDYTALSCFSTIENKYSSFMLRKKPFSDDYVGIYISPINDDNFNKSTDLDDLYMIGYHKNSSKKLIEFQYRKVRTATIYLDRISLEMNVIDGFKGLLNKYQCKIIDHKTFYNSIKDKFNKEKNKLKL